MRIAFEIVVSVTGFLVLSIYTSDRFHTVHNILLLYFTISLLFLKMSLPLLQIEIIELSI